MACWVSKKNWGMLRLSGMCGRANSDAEAIVPGSQDIEELANEDYIQGAAIHT